MCFRCGWRLAFASCLVFLSLGCSTPAGSPGTGGIGGAGGECTTEAIDACLALQSCCEAILVNPVFFESCNNVVLQCNKGRCEEVLAGYIQCREPGAGGAGGIGGSSGNGGGGSAEP